MALRFIDSCGDHYSTAQITRKWSSFVQVTVRAGTGRRGTNSLQLDNARSVTKIIDAQPTWIVGCSFKFTLLPASTASIIRFIDTATTQLDLRIDSGGKIVVTRNGTVLSTSTAALTVGLENYIELKGTIDPAAGSYSARVNGVVFTSGSGVNTRATANSSADRITFACDQTSMGTVDLDDVYICDGTGTASTNDFLGDVRVDAYMANGAGANTGMTPSANANWQCVNDNPATDDTNYVSSDVVGTKDTYTHAAMTHNPTAIYGVQAIATMRKDDAGARSGAIVTRSGGVDNDGPTTALTTSYAAYMQIRETDPSTAAAWTKTGFNSAEFGAKVAA